MAPGGPEDIGQQEAGAVDHGRLLGEVGGAGHEAEQRQAPFDAIQRAQLGPEDGQGVEGAPPGGVGPLFDAQVDAECAGMDELAVVVAGELAGGASDAGVDDHRVQRIVGRVGPG